MTHPDEDHSAKTTCWKKFLTHTHLKWPGWHTIAIWVIVLAVMASFTVRDFLPLLSEYKDNNLSTEVAVVTNDSFPRPNVTLCMTHYSSSLLTIVKSISSNKCIECDALRNRSWDVWRDMEFDAEATDLIKSMRLAEALLKRLLLEERHKNFPSLILNHSNFNWNQPLLDSVSYLLCFYGLLDHAWLIGLNGEYNSFPLCQEFDTDNVGVIDDEALDQLYRLHIDGINVYLRDGPYYDTQEHKSAIPSLIDRNPAIYGDYFCVPMIASYDGEKLTWQAFANDTDQPPWKRSPRRDNLLAKDESITYTSIPTTDVIYVTDLTKLDEIHYENVMVNWDVRSRVVDQRPQRTCSPEPVVARCFITNQLNFTVQHCGCLPFAYRHMVRQKILPYCNSTHYNACGMELRESKKKCRAECDDVCEYVVYDWQHILIADNPEYAKESRDIKFLFQLLESTKRYIEFRINLKTTPEMFMSQIGGVVNFYLGFDGLTSCAVLIFVMDTLKRYRRAKTEIAVVLPMTSVALDRMEKGNSLSVDQSANLREIQAALANITVTMEKMNERLQDHERLLEKIVQKRRTKSGAISKEAWKK